MIEINMPENVRRLTKAGIDAFREYLDRLRNGSTEAPPERLLWSTDTSEGFQPQATIEKRTFKNRLEASRYFLEAFQGSADIDEDVGLWAWLSLFYFNEVCPRRKDGSRKPGRDYRHVLETGYRHGHRHLLAGPYTVFRLHGANARLLLASTLPRESHYHHALGTRQALISNPRIIGAADRLYFDPDRQRPKRGGQYPSKPGTIVRFVDVLMQLE